MTVEVPIIDQPSEEPNLLKGYLSDCQVWKDEPGFAYNSIDGFKPPEEEDHLHPVLTSFARTLLDDSTEIRHLRLKRLLRHTVAIIVAERNSASSVLSNSKDAVTNYSPEIRTDLQSQLDDFLVPHAVTRIFRVKQSDSPIEFMAFELRDIEIDSKVVADALNGDDNSFGLIYEMYSERIKGYIVGILDNAGYSRNRWLNEEDIAHETFEKAYKARHRFVKYDNIPVASWLFTIAANTATDHFRRGHFKTLVDIPVDDNEQALKYSIDENTILELQVVGQLIEGLSKGQQQVLALGSLGYHTDEIAWMLNLPSLNDAKVQIFKGRVSLRKEYRSRQEEELGQYYLIMLTHRLLISKINRGKSYWQEGQLKTTVLQSLKGIGFRESQVTSALHQLPEDFFERMANVHTVPRQNKIANSPFVEDLEK